MKAEPKRQILSHHIIPCGKHLIGRGFIFQYNLQPILQKQRGRTISHGLASKNPRELLQKQHVRVRH